GRGTAPGDERAGPRHRRGGRAGAPGGVRTLDARRGAPGVPRSEALNVPFVRILAMSRTPEEAYQELVRRTREAAVLSSCGSLLSWDESTYMPKHGSSHRGEQMGLLARLGHEMVTAPVVGELITEVERSALVRNPESDAGANVREMRRNYDRAVK